MNGFLARTYRHKIFINKLGSAVPGQLFGLQIYRPGLTVERSISLKESIINMLITLHSMLEELVRFKAVLKQDNKKLPIVMFMLLDNIPIVAVEVRVEIIGPMVKV